MVDRSPSPLRSQIVSLPHGIRLGVAEYGDPAGRPVLALHGAPASHVMFAFADEAARRLGLRLIAPDRPACGLSPPSAKPHTLATVTDDMVALADGLRLDSFGLIGISGGGPYAVAVAARMGTRISALALVSPVGPIADAAGRVTMAAGHRWFFLELPRHRRIFRLGARIAAAAFHASPDLAASIFARLIGSPDRATLARPEARATVIAMTQDALRQGIDGPTTDLAVYGTPWGIDPASITAPTLIWQGTADVVVPPAVSIFLADRIRGSHLFRLDGAGHFWVLDHIDEVLAALAETITRSESSS